MHFGAGLRVKYVPTVNENVKVAENVGRPNKLLKAFACVKCGFAQQKVTEKYVGVSWSRSKGELIIQY